MSHATDIRVTAAHVRAAVGYACTCAWGVVVLLDPVFGSEVQVLPASISMLPGLVTCMVLILAFRAAPPPAGRVPFTCAAGVAVAAGTLLCTLPATSAIAVTRVLGLALSGLFAIVLVVAWFEEFAQMPPRTVIVLIGCAITVAALICWAILLVDSVAASVLASLLMLVAALLLPPGKCGANASVRAALKGAAGARGLHEVFAAAVPARTLFGLGTTFFVVSSIGALAPRFGLFIDMTTPFSLLVAVGVSAFFVGSALLVHHRIDSSILYKVLLTAFAAVILLLAFSMGISASLLLYANIIADAMMFTVLSLWAKKTPVQPHLVFAIAWLAECAGNILGQIAGTLLASHTQVYFVLTIVLILVAVGFAFSEGSLVVSVDFEGEGEEPDAAAGAAGAGVGKPAEADTAGADAPAADPTTTADMPAADASPDEGAPAIPAPAAPASGIAPAPAPAEGAAPAFAAVRAGGAAAAAAPVAAVAATAPAFAVAPSVEPVPSVAGAAAQETPSEAASPAQAMAEFGARHGLSKREQEVFELWVTGHGLKHIEHALFISEATVKTHLRHIYRKCDTHSRAEIIALFEREQQG